jgi:hypothetical protein
MAAGHGGNVAGVVFEHVVDLLLDPELRPSSSKMRCGSVLPTTTTAWPGSRMSQFSFLFAEFPDVFTHASRAEGIALSDPRAACFYARLALEVGVNWSTTTMAR